MQVYLLEAAQIQGLRQWAFADRPPALASRDFTLCIESLRVTRDKYFASICWYVMLVFWPLYAGMLL